jgi:hypothetical protein
MIFKITFLFLLCNYLRISKNSHYKNTPTSGIPLSTTYLFSEVSSPHYCTKYKVLNSFFRLSKYHQSRERTSQTERKFWSSLFKYITSLVVIRQFSSFYLFQPADWKCLFTSHMHVHCSVQYGKETKVWPYKKPFSDILKRLAERVFLNQLCTIQKKNWSIIRIDSEY